MRFNLSVVETRIALIEQNLERLVRLPQATLEEFTADFRTTESAKHLLQVAIEAMVDTCAHFVARLRLKVPGESAELIKALGKAGLLPRDHVNTYLQMVRFHNRVVHLYQEVDDEEVYKILQQNLDDFRTFIADAWRIVQEKG